MTVHQRRRGGGVPMRVWMVETTVDRRGNTLRSADEYAVHDVVGWVFPQRSAKAEVPGQQQINVVRIGVPADLPHVSLWSRVQFDGRDWDVVSPPSFHHGTRHTRHWSIDLRERPSERRAEGPS